MGDEKIPHPRVPPYPPIPKSAIPPENELHGSRVSYYLVRVEKPQRESQDPYTAECEDIIDALDMTFDEANMFKAIWRTANARKGNGKPEQKAVYDAEKILHYAKRHLNRSIRNA